MTQPDDATSATEPDWAREAPARPWDPSRRLIRAIRRHPTAGRFGRRWWVMQHRFWSVVTGADIPLGLSVGGGLRIPHPTGIVIHPDAVIGPNCTLMQGITIGTDRTGVVPRIGGHVDIGAGARILGGVTIGDHAQIGANAVVLRDVPAGMVAVGVPATIRAPRA